MNILVDKLPEFVTVGERRYSVYTDFRIWIEFDSIIHLDNLSAKDKTMMAINLCFQKSKVLPEDAFEAIEALEGFYLCGKKNKKGLGKSEPILDFSKDWAYIYSAFLTQYGIDRLSVPYLHWYAFCALFESLEESRKIVQIMQFRACDLNSVQNPEKKQYLKSCSDNSGFTL